MRVVLDDSDSVQRALLALQRKGIRLGLERVRKALTVLGNPHLRRSWVVVAGTNGKGSTSAFLASITQTAGYRTGLYTSPHLFTPRERIRVDGTAISATDFARLGQKVLAVIQDGIVELTFFEALTCIAFCYFAEEEVDLGVLEVGMGGRLDAVNVIHPTVTVLTSLGLDHAAHLGADPASIAREKMGICRPRVPLALAVDGESYHEVIGPRCLNDRIPVIKVGRDAIYEWRAGLLCYRGPRFRLSDVRLGLEGQFQAVNAALAVSATEHLTGRGFHVTADHVRQGLVKTEWRGRFELLAEAPPKVADVAHNPGGVEALVAALRERFGDEVRFQVFLAVHRDKDLGGILRALEPIAAGVVLAADDAQGMHTGDELAPADISRVPSFARVARLREAVDRADEAHRRGEAVLMTGSHAFVAEALLGWSPSGKPRVPAN